MPAEHISRLAREDDETEERLSFHRRGRLNCAGYSQSRSWNRTNRNLLRFADSPLMDRFGRAERSPTPAGDLSRQVRYDGTAGVRFALGAD